MMKPSLRSEKGTMLLTALGLIVLASFAVIGAEAARTFFNKQSRTVEIRAKMSSLESVIKLIALQPTTYSCPNQTAGGTMTRFADCTIIKTAFDSAKDLVVGGAQCPQGRTVCGVRLVVNDEGSTKGLALDSAGRFTATVIYEGTETPLPASMISMEIPAEVIQAGFFDCSLRDPSKPIFVGFLSNGQADCRGFANAPCPRGSFMTDIDFKGMSVTCTRLNDIPGIRRTCGSQEMIASIDWRPDGSSTTVEITCAPLPAAPYDWVPTSVPQPTPTPVPATPTPGPVPTATPTPTPEPTMGRWTKIGINGPAATQCPGYFGTVLPTGGPAQLGPCTTLGAYCTINIMGNALAGGGGRYESYQCIFY